MSSITISKTPTKKDYLVQLGMLCNIKDAKGMGVINLLIIILNDTLKKKHQQKSAIQMTLSSLGGWVLG